MMNFSDETVEKVARVKHKRECGHLKQSEQDTIWARDAEYLKADAKAALSSLTLADLMPWQPIETAPKDGATVLLFRPDAPPYFQVTLGKWCDDKYARKAPKPYWATWHSIGSVTQAREHIPTHWMPLPNPPTEAK